jgi:chromosome segregation ATPase
MRRIVWLAAAAMLAVPASALCQQADQGPAAAPQDQSQAQAAPAPQQESLAEAARKAREQKKETPKSAKTFDNDNIPSQGGISSVGEGTAAPSAGNEAAQGAAAKPANDEKSWRDKFAALRHKLEQDQADLDVMQRELGVLNTQFYTDPTKAMQQQLTRSDINNKIADIDKKKAQIEADQQAISDAEDQLRKSGGDPGWAR